MRLAREHDLHRPPRITQDRREPFRVVEEQWGALVRREPPRKADRQRALVECLQRGDQLRDWLAAALDLLPQPRPDELHELPPQQLPCVPQRGGRDAVRVPPPVVLRSRADPTRLQIPVVQGLHLRRQPRLCVNPVGYVVDWHIIRIMRTEDVLPRFA